jgi:enoyl-CoA hydratase/carnithine racemase
MFTDGLADQPSLASMSAMSNDEFSEVVDGYQQAFTIWREISPIVIAAVHGYAIGAGFQLALGADFIVATDDAWFSMKEVQLGLVPDLAGTAPLVDAVGYAKALEICTTGRDISAIEAVDLGFVARIADAAEFDGLVNEVTAAVIRGPGRSARDVKRVLRGSQLRDISAQRERERRIQHERVIALSKMLGAQ